MGQNPLDATSFNDLSIHMASTTELMDMHSLGSTADASMENVSATSRDSPRNPKDVAFWLVFLSLCISSFLSALDLTTISTALPTIIADLENVSSHSKTPRSSSPGAYIWVGSAFALTGTAILPWTGGLAQIWGRKGVLILSLFLFLAGSAICGSARSLDVLIAGRAIQGLGDGGIISLSEIIISDLVPLSERGTFEGILGVVWAVASAIGPPLGGVFSHGRHWRWLFYMNLPISLLALVVVSIFMVMKVPPSSTRSKLAQMDWWGNSMIILGMVGLTLATTWGNVRFPWASPQILVPLILGAVLFFAFFVYELRFARHPTIPSSIVSNRTSVAGLIIAVLHGLLAMAVIYILPTYFQACLGAHPMRSGIMILPLALTIAPFAMLGAIWVEYSQTYVIQTYIGSILSVVGISLLTLLKMNSKPILWICLQFPIGAGLGILFTVPQFAVLAPLDTKFAAQALALYTFASSFGQTLGIVASEAVLQSSLLHNLQNSTTLGPLASNLSFSDISIIDTFPKQVRETLRQAFAHSIKTVWLTMIPFAALGVLCCIPIKAFELHEETDNMYGMVDKTDASDSSRDLQASTIEINSLM